MCVQVPCVYLLSAASTVIRNSKCKRETTVKDFKQCYDVTMITKQHVNVHAACSFPRCMSMSMLHVLSMLHVHVHAVCLSPCYTSFPYFMSMSLLLVHVHPSCWCLSCGLCSCCMPMPYRCCLSMLRVHRMQPSWLPHLQLFVRGGVNSALRTAVHFPDGQDHGYDVQPLDGHHDLDLQMGKLPDQGHDGGCLY